MGRVRAIVALRFRLLARRLRGEGGSLNAVAAIVFAVCGAALALVVAVVAGVLIHVFVVEGDLRRLWIGLSVAFYLALFLGLLVPLLRGALEGFDAAPFVVFPISRPRLYAITLGAGAGASDHLLYYPLLAAVALAAVRPPAVDAAAGLALIALFALFLLVWSNALTLFLVSVMRARRIRELAAMLALVLLIGASFFPVLLDSSDGALRALLSRPGPAARIVLRLARVLPPSIAADGLTALHGPHGGSRAATGVLALFAWNLAGLWVGYAIFARFHLGESRGRAARRERRADGRPRGRPFALDGPVFSRLPPEVRAVAAKDLRYIFRSVIGRFNLVMVPLLVVVVVFLIGRSVDEPLFGLEPERLLLFALVWYAVLFSNNFLNNAFAWEAGGVQSYFVCPVSPRRVLLGKNLAVWLFNAIVFAILIVTWSATQGPPGPATLLSAALLFASAISFQTSSGNFVSVLFPVPRDVAGLRNQPSQMGMLLSLAVLLLSATLAAPLLTVPLLLGWPAVQPLLLAGLLAGSIVLYALTLDRAARLLERRGERLIAALRSPR